MRQACWGTCQYNALANVNQLLCPVRCEWVIFLTTQVKVKVVCNNNGKVDALKVTDNGEPHV